MLVLHRGVVKSSRWPFPCKPKTTLRKLFNQPKHNFMTVRISLTHRTHYRYDRHVRLGPQTIRLRPAPHVRTPIVSYALDIQPNQHFLNWHQDPFGNYEARVIIPDPTDEFIVSVDLIADMVAVNPFDFFLEDNAYYAPFDYAPDLRADLAPYLVPQGQGTMFSALAREAMRHYRTARGDLRTIDYLVALNQRLQRDIGYVVRMEPGIQTPEETLKLAKGSCRDSTWLLVNLLRHVGIAARFVSGYLVQLTADEKSLDGPTGPAADFTDLHAWAEAYIPGAGWIGLDPTSGLFAGEGHIPLAATPNPGSAAPIFGGLEASKVEFDVDMQVTRLREPARITKPLTPAQVADIDATADAVDALLQAGDVRLTMGGEPTFVSARDRDAEEWNTAAMGPTKQGYADRLARGLQRRFAPGGLLIHGQGKWYPGEPLPRWALSILWRRDGAPLWQNPNLIADENAALSPPDAADARRFIHALAETLGVPGDNVQPLFEDPAHYLFEEANLPPNLTPATNQLENPIDRARLARVFDHGLSTPVAMILPLRQAHVTANRQTVTWQSERWQTRRGKLYAIPGDSAAGFRLPLKALPWVKGARTPYPEIYTPDPFQPQHPLHRPQVSQPQSRPTPTETGDVGLPFDNATTPVRTALVAEPRNGILHIFLPPLDSAEAFVTLTAAVEHTAQMLETPVRIEGYPPPNDPRLNEIKVTPDPAVIEVNIHPARTWPELRTITRDLYAEARAIGLDTAGFQLDGRPQGSGGGAHMVLGGATPGDSPFLRRPDVLGSLIRLWQRHPSLSYLFAGQFIGPTSQAPRLDEARTDLIDDVELALGQLPGPEATDFPPWLVDRVLRNLLVDATGNTHRAEISIDKLYSPDGPAGRLGLVEFRAFEMPPHWHMTLAQHVLVRALVAWVWQRPVTAPLRNHGPALHDKFMLPDVLWADFCDLLAELSLGLGVRIDPEWYRAQFDFRFPMLGQFETDDVLCEMRAALEPWHVLGEEGINTGTTRFVDSSLNRLQVQVSGRFDPDRHTLLCNLRPVPLQPVSGRRVGGVRFRTWQPVSALHPTIPATPKLTFDLFSKVDGRAIGGATYWATHPGGRNFETRPINAREAESRIRQRFFAGGHSAGPITPEAPRINPHTPWTLDLRR